MNKIQFFILPFFMTVFLAGCGQRQETEMSPYEMVSVIEQSQQELSGLNYITSADAEFASYLSDYYLIDAEQAADGAIGYANGVEASEIAVLRMADGQDPEAIQTVLNDYMQSRAGVFEGYAPQQAALVKNGIVAVNGSYAALLICPDASAAKTAFLSCFGEGKQSGSAENAASVPSDTADKVPDSVLAEEPYDSASVLQAWRSGDDSSLSEMNRCILHAAEDVIDREIRADMSDYEKELAVHDWITAWSSFDSSVFGRSSEKGFQAGSDTPYGVLIERRAMCHGYSSAFQLFMDMLDIECITVFGLPGSNGVEHSWNMVKLDGEWYCVDTAWDDPIGGEPGHTYFNVTSDFLRKGSIHRWDEASVPEATGTAYAYPYSR